MPTKRKIYFRADAGPEIGYGHYIRSVALADMLKQDFDCTMFTQTPTDYQLRECESVCPIVVLPNDDTKFDKFLEYLHGDEIVVLDNYFFTTDYQCAIKAKGCKLVCIDDMHDKHYVADVVINHGCDNPTLFDKEEYTHLCLGFDYALLRRPFLENHNDIERQKGLFVVCFGGSDPHNLTHKYVEHLIISQGVSQVVAVVGDGYQYQDTLNTIPNVEVRSRLSASEIANLFCNAEAVVCSASTTAYEALACGARVYAGRYVDNQLDFYKHLCTSKAVVPLGNLLENEPSFDTNAKTASVNLNASKYDLRKAFWQLAWREVNYTELTETESRQVWQTRNLPTIRQWMFNPNSFTWEEHSHYVASLAQRQDKLYMAFFDGEQLMASYDLIDIHDSQAECGLYLHPDYDGKGIASMVDERMEEIAREKGIQTLTSQVLNTNTTSLAFFTRKGFRAQAKDENVTLFVKQI